MSAAAAQLRFSFVTETVSSIVATATWMLLYLQHADLICQQWIHSFFENNDVSHQRALLFVLHEFFTAGTMGVVEAMEQHASLFVLLCTALRAHTAPALSFQQAITNQSSVSIQENSSLSLLVGNMLHRWMQLLSHMQPIDTTIRSIAMEITLMREWIASIQRVLPTTDASQFTKSNEPFLESNQYVLNHHTSHSLQDIDRRFDLLETLCPPGTEAHSHLNELQSILHGIEGKNFKTFISSEEPQQILTNHSVQLQQQSKDANGEEEEEDPLADLFL